MRIQISSVWIIAMVRILGLAACCGLTAGIAPSKALVAWAKDHNMTIEQAAVRRPAAKIYLLSVEIFCR